MLRTLSLKKQQLKHRRANQIRFEIRYEIRLDMRSDHILNLALSHVLLLLPSLVFTTSLYYGILQMQGQSHVSMIRLRSDQR